jgi:hypothetical protein
MAITSAEETILKQIAAEKKLENDIKILNDAAAEEMAVKRAELTAIQQKLSEDVAALRNK